MPESMWDSTSDLKQAASSTCHAWKHHLPVNNTLLRMMLWTTPSILRVRIQLLIGLRNEASDSDSVATYVHKSNLVMPCTTCRARHVGPALSSIPHPTVTSRPGSTSCPHRTGSTSIGCPCKYPVGLRCWRPPGKPWHRRPWSSSTPAETP